MPTTSTVALPQPNSTAGPGTTTATTPAVEIRGVSRAFGGVEVLRDVSLTVPRGEFLALLGGSGCGKTTLLRIIAGLESPDVGTVLIGGIDRTATPPYERPVNMMFQSYALFPHLSVGSNVEYGLRAAGVGADARRGLVDWALRLVRLEGYSARKPDQLSGGQRQRVALARCLVKKPDVLLLDEPMAALDRGLREEMQRELVRIQRDVGSTFILVTHDQDEALSVADRIAVMHAGRIVQIGSPSSIYDRPATRMVAKFVGRVNLFEGRASVDGSRSEIVCDDGIRVRVTGQPMFEAGADRAAAVRPENVVVAREVTARANDYRGTIESLAYFGDMTRAEIRLASGRVIEATLPNLRQPGERAFASGDSVHAAFDEAAVVVIVE